MNDRKHIDYYLLLAAAALILLGVFALSNVSATLSYKRFGATDYYLIHQVCYGLLPGLALGFLVFKIPLKTLKRFAFIIMLVNLLLMAAVFIPGIGINLKGAHRWIHLGIVTFQPSEFLKLTFVIYLAALLTSWREKRKSQKLAGRNATLLPFFAMLAVIALLLVLQSDISTLCIIILTAIIIYFLTETPVWHTIIGIIAVAAGLAAFIKIEPYRLQRILVFLNPETDPLGIGYQTKQALIAIGSGGIMGVGPGMSRQKLGFLPEAMSDSIFAIFAEEMGFVGAAILIFLFIFFLWRALRVSKLAGDNFSRLIAAGATVWITIQAFINIGSMTGIAPLAGIPLPFFSLGGSALIAEIAAVGILLNISKNASQN